MNGMLVSSAPIRSVGAVTVESKPGMTEQEKSNLEKELEMIKVRLQKTEQELSEEKKLTESQVHSFPFRVNLSACLSKCSFKILTKACSLCGMPSLSIFKLR